VVLALFQAKLPWHAGVGNESISSRIATTAPAGTGRCLMALAFTTRIATSGSALPKQMANGTEKVNFLAKLVLAQTAAIQIPMVALSRHKTNI